MTTPPGNEDGGQNLCSEDLKKKTRSSILWTLCRAASDQVFSFVVFVILARLLSPHEIGTFTIAIVFSEIGRVIAVEGMVQNIPRAKTMSPTLTDTVFWTNLGMAFLIALAVWLLARPMLDLIDQPDAAAPLQALGFVLPIVALGATHMALRLREFGHKSLALRSVVSGTIGGVAAVVAAFDGWGVWSLVVQRFVTESVNTIVAWQAFKWMPGRNFSLAQLRSIGGFGANLTLTQIIITMHRKSQDLIIGAIIGATAVGIYRIAWGTATFVNAGTIQPFTTVALQTLSRLQGDTEALVKAYRWMISTSAMVSFPALVGFGVLAPDAVPAIYGAKWVEAGRLAQIFAFLVVPASLAAFALPVLTALGRGANLRTLVIVQLTLTVGLTLLAAPYGVFAVAWVYVGRTYLTLPLQMWFLRRASGITAQNTFTAIVAPFFASTIMGVGVWCFMAVIRPHLSVTLITILVGVAAGVLLYAIALYALSADVRRLIRRHWQAHRAKKAGK